MKKTKQVFLFVLVASILLLSSHLAVIESPDYQPKVSVLTN